MWLLAADAAATVTATAVPAIDGAEAETEKDAGVTLEAVATVVVAATAMTEIVGAAGAGRTRGLARPTADTGMNKHSLVRLAAQRLTNTTVGDKQQTQALTISLVVC